MAVDNNTSHSLLLLSPAPYPPTYLNIKAAYNPAINTALREISRTFNGRKILDVALPCPHLYAQEQTPRSVLYKTTQQLLANVYKLVTVISTTQNIDVEDAEGVDVRVLLVAFPKGGNLESIVPGLAGEDLTGPVITVNALANSRRPWTTIYAVDTEQGEQVLKLFQQSGPAYTNIQRIRGGISLSCDPSAEQGVSSPHTRHYSIAVGGTFDHLHIGHKLLLTMSAFMADNLSEDSELWAEAERSLTIGITSGELLKNKKYAECLESWDERQRSTWDFIAAIMLFTRTGAGSAKMREIKQEEANGHAVHYLLPSGFIVKLVEIWDPFGPTITDKRIDALVLSAETRSGGKAVNDRRKEENWPELDIYEVDVLDAEEGDGCGTREQADDVKQQFASKLSSTAIRKTQSERSEKRQSKV